MSAFIELRVEGDRRALIEAGSIAGFITSENGRVDTIASKDAPIAVILRGGETLNVYGESIATIVVRAAQIRKEVREHGFDLKADFLDQPDYVSADNADANIAA